MSQSKPLSLYKLVLSAVCDNDGKGTGTIVLEIRGCHLTAVGMMVSLVHQ